MFYVKSKNSRTGVTYVYESESYWDKDKKMPCAKRKLIGRIDEETGEIVPNGKRGRKRKDPDGKIATLEETLRAEIETRYAELMQSKDTRIAELEAENRQLKAKDKDFKKALTSLIQQYDHPAKTQAALEKEPAPEEGPLAEEDAPEEVAGSTEQCEATEDDSAKAQASGQISLFDNNLQ